MGDDRLMIGVRRHVRTASRRASLKLARETLRFLPASGPRAGFLAPVRKARPGSRLLRSVQSETFEGRLAGRVHIRARSRDPAAKPVSSTRGEVGQAGLRRTGALPDLVRSRAKTGAASMTRFVSLAVHAYRRHQPVRTPRAHASGPARRMTSPRHGGQPSALAGTKHSAAAVSARAQETGRRFAEPGASFQKRSLPASDFQKMPMLAAGFKFSRVARASLVPGGSLPGRRKRSGVAPGASSIASARRGPIGEIAHSARAGQARSLAPKVAVRGGHEASAFHGQPPQGVRHDPPAAGSSALWPGSEPHGPRKADIGRTVSDLLAAEARRPPWGIAAFDARSAPIWPGRKPAF